MQQLPLGLLSPESDLPGQNTLREVFGLDRFRPHQAEAIAANLAKRDALVVLPTGAGKSLCYQVIMAFVGSQPWWDKDGGLHAAFKTPFFASLFTF